MPEIASPDLDALRAQAGAEITAWEQENGPLLEMELNTIPPVFGLDGYGPTDDLTEKFFFMDETTGPRGYRTGDLCYWKNALYYYCGRADNQLKLNGYRIELEDIEQNLQKLPNVQRAAVLPVWKGEKVEHLAAFLLLREQDGLTPLKRTVQLKKQAAAFLPAYMIPRKMIAVDNFPLNVNGKIDRKALAAQLGRCHAPLFRSAVLLPHGAAAPARHRPWAAGEIPQGLRAVFQHRDTGHRVWHQRAADSACRLLSLAGGDLPAVPAAAAPTALAPTALAGGGVVHPTPRLGEGWG